ncbi:hypothetical protein REPUB_Repub01dG0226800 [Reevesia pubescens]
MAYSSDSVSIDMGTISLGGKAAEAGIRQIGSLAHQQTMSMIEERASLPIISLQPVVAGAARKTSHAVGQATKTIMNIIYRGELLEERVDWEIMLTWVFFYFCRFEDKEVQRDMKLVPYKIVNKDGKPYIQVKIKDGETKVFSPEEIRAMSLIKMKETAEAFRVPWSYLIMLVTWQALSCHCMLGRRQIFDLYIVLVNVVKGLKLYEDVFTNSELAKLSDFWPEWEFSGAISLLNL